MKRLLYISESHIKQDDDEETVVAQIIEDAQEKNARLHNLTVSADGPIIQRCYADWSMEYLVPSIFVHKQIEGFLQQANAARGRSHEIAH